MEEKGSHKNNKQQQSSYNARHQYESIKSIVHQKGARKVKKDNLREKKKNKNSLKDESNNINGLNSIIVKHPTQSQLKQPINQHVCELTKDMSLSLFREKLAYPLDKILKKPSYLIISDYNIISGNFGHSTAIFKRPILEGSFFMEFIYRQDKKKERKVIYQSAIRIGLCIHDFNCSFPLGWQESIAYKSLDGSLVYKNEVIKKGESFKVGDQIGILVNMSPPHKHADIQKINENSSILFYKNGILIHEFRELKQAFYCFAISLYNYSQVEIVLSKQKKQIFLDSNHYFDCLRDGIPYKDLQQKGIFKI